MYFENVTSFEELKTEYRRLAKLHHPDFNGSEEVFKKVNADYERKTKEFLDKTEEKEKKDGFKETAETMEAYKNIIDELLKYDNVFIEVCGVWLWISGDTKLIKDKLKKLGCFWASKKSKWYYRPAEYKSFSRKDHTMDYIREKYGSNHIQKKQKIKIGY